MESNIIPTAHPLTDGESTVFYEIDCSESSHTKEDFIKLSQHAEYAHLCKIFVQGLGLRNEDFTPSQLVAIYAALESSDVFVALPPGSGKSAIFQILGLHQKARPGMTIVLTPLISLIKNQLLKLSENRIFATGIWGGQNEELKTATYSMLQGEVLPTFLYLTPESFYNEEIHTLLMNLYDNGHIARIVVDEAQVILEWRSFKAIYRNLRNLKQQFQSPALQIMLLSGSIGTLKAKELALFLGVTGCKLITKNPDRENIFYTVQPKHSDGLPGDIIKFLKITQEAKLSGIIYCRSPGRCQEILQLLEKEGIDAMMFHGGDSNTSDWDKDDAQRRWQSNEVTLIVATIAFGLGIDKCDVRFVIHADLPKSMGHYIQETGRAGRDNKLALCILLYKYSDATKVFKMAKRGQHIVSDKELYDTVIPDCLELVRMCEDHPWCCRRKSIMNHYQMEANLKEDSCGKCDICYKEPPPTALPITDKVKVKVEHVIKLVLDTFTRSLEGPDPYLTVAKLAELVSKNLGEVDRTMEDTYECSIASGSDFGMSCRMFFNGKIWPHLVKKTVIHLILEGVFKEIFIKSKQNFYLQRDSIPDNELIELIKGATVNLRIYEEDFEGR